MFNLELNPKIKSKISFLTPVRFGSSIESEKHLFSYSIFEDHSIREIRFQDRQVIKYNFDETLFLSSREVFDEEGKLIKGEKYEFLKESESEMEFREYYKYTAAGNVGTITTLDKNIFKLNWRRVDSFLGYKISAILHGSSLSSLVKEEYFRWDKQVTTLDRVIINHIQYRDTDIDLISKSILTEGWRSTESLQQLFESFNSR